MTVFPVPAPPAPRDAAATLHPRRSVLAQVSTPLRTLGVVRDREEAISRARKILESLEIRREIWESQPHEISGGQAQRVSIARALALLRLRASPPLFSLGSTRLIQDKLSFPGAGFGAPAGGVVLVL